MEERAVKFPIATVFLAISSIMELSSAIAFTRVFFDDFRIMAVLSYLTVAINWFIIILLIIKNRGKLLFAATACLLIPLIIPFVVYIGGFLRGQMSIGIIDILNLLTYVLLALVVGVFTVFKSDKCRMIVQKIYFLPAVIYNVSQIIALINAINASLEFSIIVQYFLGVAVNLGFIFFIAKWCADPYKKENPKKESGYTAVYEEETRAKYNDFYFDLVEHTLLCIFTFGIWTAIWIYRTTKLLNRAKHCEQYDPVKKLLLCIFVPFYQIYWLYKHGQKLDDISREKNLNSSDITTLCLIFGILFNVAACILIQYRMNEISRVTDRTVDSVTINQPIRHK